MARGNKIVVSSNPKGHFEEIIVSGTPKPGTVMELKLGTSIVNGRWTYEPAGTTAANSTYSGMAADGNNLPIAVLTNTNGEKQGKLATDAKVDGDAEFIYFPLPGEELNCILMDQSGTGAGEDFVIGTKLIVDDGTGKLVASVSTPEAEPFTCLELKTDLAADYLCWVKFNG